MFVALGSRAAIDKALQRMVAKGLIRRLSRGLYDKLRHDDLFGTLWPSIDAVVKAIAGTHRIRTQPIGVYAANLLGMSEQVPAKVILLTDGPSRTVRVGPSQITLRRTTPRQMAAAGALERPADPGFQELRSAPCQTPRPHPDAARADSGSPSGSRLAKDIALAPAWMRPLLTERWLARMNAARAGAEAT